MLTPWTIKLVIFPCFLPQVLDRTNRSLTYAILDAEIRNIRGELEQVGRWRGRRCCTCYMSCRRTFAQFL